MPISAVLGYLGAQEQAGATEAAANTSAAAQREAARQAAEAAKFRPVGITTRYGTSNFQFDPSGYLTGAGYNVNPELQAYQNRLMGLTGRALSQAEQAQQQYQPLSTAATGLFGLGQQYLAQSPEQVAADYMAKQQDLLAPIRERQMAQLQNQLFQQGRGGLSIGATGARPSGAAGLGATTPEMEAYYNAIAQQDATLASQAQQAGQKNVAFGAGLYESGAGLLNQYQTGQVGALSPFTTYLSSGESIEKLGQQPLTLGAGLGGQSAAYGGAVGQSLLQGGMSAAKTQQAGQGYSPLAGLLQGAANSPRLQTGFENFFGGGGGYQMNDPNTHYGTQGYTPQQIGSWNDSGGGFTGYVPL